MFQLPSKILIEDEFLRDGLQNEKRIFSLSERLQFMKAIEDAGVRRIQVGSFVHPKWVPQMAATDELFDLITPKDGVIYSALIVNKAGLDRAIAARVKHLSISMSASETHSQKNTNRSVQDSRAVIRPTIEKALAEGIAVRAGIQSALGCGFEGNIDPTVVIGIARDYAALGVREINIADTAGLANPKQVFELCTQLFDVLPDIRLSLHLHDTRGLGLANMVAGMQAGVDIFDAAMGGLGGCPFIPDAAGNIATEDAAYLCEQVGVATGIRWQELQSSVKAAEHLLQRNLPSKISQLGNRSMYLEVAK